MRLILLGIWFCFYKVLRVPFDSICKDQKFIVIVDGDDKDKKELENMLSYIGSVISSAVITAIIYGILNLILC